MSTLMTEPIPEHAYLWRPYAYDRNILRPVRVDRRDLVFAIDPWTQRWAIVEPAAASMMRLADGRHRLSEIIRELAADPDVAAATGGYAQLASELYEIGLLFDTQAQHRSDGGPVYSKADLAGFHLEITNACNMRCEHCYVSSGRKMPGELTFDEIVATIDMLPPFSGKRIAISGGEPAVRKDCRQIVEHCAVRCGHDVDLYTNGKRFPEALARRIVEINAGPGGTIRIQVSLEGSDAQTNDAVRGKGSFDHAMRSLEMFRRVGVNREVVIFVCATRENIDQVDALIAIAERFDVGMLVFSQWQRQGNAQDTPWEQVAPSTEHWVAAGERILAYDNPRLRVFGNFYGDLRNDENGRLNLDRPLFPKHIYPYNAFPRIAPDGEVWADQLWVDRDWVLGNVKDGDLDACFDEPKFYEQLEAMRARPGKIPQCSSCEWRELCQGGSPGHTYAEYGHMDMPDVFCASRKYWFERFVDYQVKQAVGP